jgi:uncharacterized membrane protein
MYKNIILSTLLLCTEIICGAEIEKVTDISIKDVDISKMVYSPGEKGKVNFKIVNTGQNEWNGKIVLKTISGITDSKLICKKPVIVPSKGAIDINEIFEVGNTLFGHELIIELRSDKGGVLSRNLGVYTVAENFWDVALGTINNGILHSTGRYGKQASKIIKNRISYMRKHYSNWFEIDFWAPDDWGNMTPKEEEWISGQAARWQNKKVMKELIAEGHKYGIKAITYGKGIAGGPSAWELLRQRPELFMRSKKTGRWGGNPDLRDFDNWNNPKLDHYKDFSSIWHRLPPDFSKKAALDHGIQELINSTKEYGWDGVRFDGHFSAMNDVVSTYNMRQVKEKIWQEFPDYLFGFNLCSVFGYGNKMPHELREAMAGGSHWMQEGIGSFQFKDSLSYYTWKDYAEKEKIASQKVQDIGGTYHYIYRLGICQNDVVKYYKFVIGTLNGAHPDFGAHEKAPGCKNWGEFLTRWGGLFWHPNRRALDLKKNEIVTTGIPENVIWKTWSKSIPVSSNIEQLVIPFLILPKTEAIKDTQSFPAPVSGGTVDFSKSVFKSRIKKLYWLTPESIRAKQLQIKNGIINLPLINPLGVLVIELNGCPDYKGINRPKFTDPVSTEELKKSRDSDQKIVIVDPLRPELNIINDGKTELQESEKHSWSMNRLTFDDSEASAGKVAGVDKSFDKSFCMGAYFHGLQPGVYKITMRVKMSQGLTGGFHKNIYENIPLGKGKYKRREGTPRSQTWGYVKYSDLNIEPDKFEEVVILDKYEHYGLGFLTFFLQGSLKNEKSPKARFFLDWVKIERIEEYTDKKIAEKLKLKESPLIKVGKRSDILWIRGMYDDLYHIPEAINKAFPKAELTTKYQQHGMPKTIEDLAPYGTIIMPNVPVDSMGVKTRKAYTDWCKAGGHLLILGGSMSLGQGAMKGTFFEDILPCKIIQNADMVKLPEKSRIKYLKALSDNIVAENTPLEIYYAHITKAKPEAEIIASTGEIPLWMTVPVNKGRCSVFTGTVSGAEKATPTAFWNSKIWVDVFANIIGIK